MTIYSQLERLKVEQTADVFQFVKASRLKRKGLIRHLVSAHTGSNTHPLIILYATQEHYVFCHDVLEEFIDCIEKQGNVESDI